MLRWGGMEVRRSAVWRIVGVVGWCHTISHRIVWCGVVRCGCGAVPALSECEATKQGDESAGVRHGAVLYLYAL